MDALERWGKRRGQVSAAWMILATATSAGLSCSSDSKESPDTEVPADVPQDAPLEPGVPVEYAPQSDGIAQIAQQLTVIQEWDAADLLDEYPVGFEDELGFDPLEAINYDVIQASTLALTPAEEALFAERGFVITAPVRFATFTYGYHNIYGEDLPVYITADSVLDALHRSYDNILKELEVELLIPTFDEYLPAMRANAATSNLPAQTRRDVDLFLAVAQSLLTGSPVTPAEASFEPVELTELFDAAMAAADFVEKELFGVKRTIDFSQFTPRGHYTDTEELARYFRAMMWMGRIDLRMIETQENGEVLLHRRQVEAMFALHGLMTDAERAQWDTIDRIVTAFVGQHDYMHAAQVPALQADLGAVTLEQLALVDDQTLTATLIEGNYGEQRIHSHYIMKEDVFGPTLPLNVSFALFGQRYVLDSHVFSQVVYDRVPDRAVPNPLDAAFAALGNNHAAHLLRPELEQLTFAANLGAMRTLADEQPEENWSDSLYTLWLSSLRELSARETPAGTAVAETTEAMSDIGSGLPSVTKTEAWGRRLLNTQLGSWAQLRHDTLLYAKQSYTVGGECEFPDAYVDPYPEFWARIIQLAERGTQIIDGLQVESSTLQRATDYFQRLSSIVSVLHSMSLHQLSGQAHSAEDIAFVNDVVRISGGGSGPPTAEGWFHQLLFDPHSFHEVDNVIADVHTDPGGDIPPRGPSVLHVGTAYPRLMVVAVETCSGPRAYAGPVFDYKELELDEIRRLNDEEWQDLLRDAPPPEVPWMQPIVGPETE